MRFQPSDRLHCGQAEFRVSRSMGTALTKTLGIRYPIIQAPIGSLCTPELVAAVSNAGGLGMHALSWHPLDAIAATIAATQKLTDRPFAINLVLVWPQHERLEAALEAGVKIVSLSWGDPAPYLPRIRSAGAKCLVTVSSSAEAQRALAAGADVIVAQGVEAGGHVQGSVGSLALTPAVVDVARSYGKPVVTAGGIGDGRGLAAALSLGASGVWLGTRFVVCAESCAHPEYQKAIQRADENSPLHNFCFDIGWPNAAVRTLPNSTYKAWADSKFAATGSRPGEGDIVGHYKSGYLRGLPVIRYSTSPPSVKVDGEWEPLALYAGQSCGVIRAEVVPTAAEIVQRIVADAQQALQTASQAFLSSTLAAEENSDTRAATSTSAATLRSRL